MARYPLERQHVLEIINGMLGEDGENILPSSDLRKALAKASGLNEREIYQIICDEYSKIKGGICDPYILPGPLLG